MSSTRKYLIKLGLSFSPNALVYLADAIDICKGRIKERKRISMTEIYALVAAKNGSTAIRVERSIRYVVQTAFKSNLEMWRDLGVSKLYGQEAMSNIQFISTCAFNLLEAEKDV